MRTWWPNLKKCLTVKPRRKFVSLIALASALLFASLARASSLSTPSLESLRKELALPRASNSFEPLLQSWQARYGSTAAGPLLILASEPLEDPERYMAFMGAARLGGREGAPNLVRFLKDRSWMLRSAALRALAALKNPATASSVLPLLQDPALVVRLEAVEAVEKLQPPGAVEALTATLESRDNYHGGKAQWVPQKALLALASLHAQGQAPRLKKLLEHENDPELQIQTVSTLESLTGKHLGVQEPLPQRVREWKQALK
jgi:HEAT repeat protein